jgi:GT2 family glycosyltransferase
MLPPFRDQPAMTSPQPATVTVCIPTYNQSAYLAGAVRSALRQTVAPTAVIVGDDASTDDTPRVMAELMAADPRVAYHRNPVNLGIAGNNTSLMRLATSEFVLRLDSDDELEPGYIAALLPVMQANPRAGYGHAAVQRVDAAGQPLSQVFLNRRPGFQPADEALRAAVSGYRVAANIVIYRREALVEMNYFEGRPDYVEDQDLAARMAAAGWGNVYADQMLSRYRVWTDAAGTRSRRKHVELRGYIRLYDEVFTPAFTQRGWPDAPLVRRRHQLALEHSNYCFFWKHDKPYHAQLVALLRELGDGPALKAKMLLLHAGAAPAFEWFYKFRGRCKLTVKRGLTLLRARRQATAQ